MPVVEKVAGAPVSVRGIGDFDIGDRAEVSHSDAEYLLEGRSDFELVDAGGDPDATAEADAEEPDDAPREEDGPPDLAVDGEDFSANGWLDNDYQDRADAVRAGGLDDSLDEIEDAETSQTVIDAVEERRAKLVE